MVTLGMLRFCLGDEQLPGHAQTSHIYCQKVTGLFKSNFLSYL